MPCDEYGGKVSMTVRAEPVGSSGRFSSSNKSEPAWFQPVPAAQPVPQGEPSQPQAPAESSPVFFTPPGLHPLEEAVTQASFDQLGSGADPVFAAYPGPIPSDPAYPQPPASGSPPPGSDVPTPVLLAADPTADWPLASGPMGRFRSRSGRLRGRLGVMCLEAKDNLSSDHHNYYDCESMAKLAGGLVLGSVLANTSIDQDVQDWYQQDVRSSGTNDYFDFWKTFGEGHIFVPSYACLAVACRFFEDRPIIGLTGEFNARVTRAYLVGAPSVLFMQFMLGASRPGETDHSSHWDPFQDTNSVSGHSFVGAVPFLTAANMTDSLLLKSGFYACSVMTGISRVNDNDHYLSQIVLGWWMAYLACEAVDGTQLKRRRMAFVPIASTEMVGIGAICEF